MRFELCTCLERGVRGEDRREKSLCLDSHGDLGVRILEACRMNKGLKDPRGRIRIVIWGRSWVGRGTSHRETDRVQICNGL